MFKFLTLIAEVNGKVRAILLVFVSLESFHMVVIIFFYVSR